MMLDSEMTVAVLFDRLRRGWIVLAGAIVIGALIGLIAAGLLPSHNRATASLGIGIDYGRTQPLDPNAERQALLQVQYLLLSDEVLTSTLELAEVPLAALTPEELRAMIRLDRYEGRWDLQVDSADPLVAQSLADGWARAGVAALERAVAAAASAQGWQAAMFPVGCELIPVAETELRYWRCLQPEGELTTADIPPQLLAQVQASHGILPGLTFAYLQGESAAEARSLSSVWLALGGSLIGLSAALIAATLALPPFLDSGGGISTSVEKDNSPLR